MLHSSEIREPVCIIGGSGKIGNKVMSLLTKEYDALKLHILLTRYTANQLTATILNSITKHNHYTYRQLLNTRISAYNKDKPTNAQRLPISTFTPIYFDIEQAYHANIRIFIFCGQDSNEVHYFLSKLAAIRDDNSSYIDPITFLSIADRLDNDNGINNDLNEMFKNINFIAKGIFYHHADIITETGEQIKNAIKDLTLTYPIGLFKYKIYDFWPGKPYGKAYNTTRKICRLLGCTANHPNLSLTKNMPDETITININDNLSVDTARYVADSTDVSPTYQWLRNNENPELPSIGIEIIDNNNGTTIHKNVFFFKDKETDLTEDLARHTYNKMETKRAKDKKAILSI